MQIQNATVSAVEMQEKKKLKLKQFSCMIYAKFSCVTDRETIKGTFTNMTAEISVVEMQIFCISSEMQIFCISSAVFYGLVHLLQFWRQFFVSSAETIVKDFFDDDKDFRNS